MPLRPPGVRTTVGPDPWSPYCIFVPSFNVKDGIDSSSMTNLGEVQPRKLPDNPQTYANHCIWTTSSQRSNL